MSLRTVPNLITIRPADANETAHAWRVALEQKSGPVALVLTRQNLPVIDLSRTTNDPDQLEKGAYILRDSHRIPDVILIASGSEVKVALEAQESLEKEDIAARVVSMPSWELFEKQDTGYKEKVFPETVKKRIAIEAGATLGWYKYITDEGAIIGIDKFGESAPGDELMKEFGFTAENVVKHAKQLIKGY
jgi:transketolase